MPIKYTVEDINSKKPIDSRLTALSLFKKENGLTYAHCICKCGNEKDIITTQIVAGHTKSCGCYNIERIKQTCQKFFPANSKIHHCWMGMIDRCYNEKNSRFHCYGGKGVTVCDEWKNNYQVFLDWAIANGWEKGLQIDKDIKGNGMLYSPETCCFVTPKVNANKRTTCRYYQYKGATYSLMEICRIANVKYDCLQARLDNGWDLETAIITPKINKWTRHLYYPVSTGPNI